MKIWLSSEMESDVADDCRVLRNEIEKKINENFQKKSIFSLGVDKLALIFIILGPNSGLDYSEIKKYRKKKKEVEFRLKVDHSTFLNSNLEAKRKMLLQTLLRAVRLIPDLNVENFDVEIFEDAVKDVANKMKWKI